MSQVAVVTGVGRLRGIAAAIVRGLAEDGWDVAGVFSADYDDRMPWGRDREAQVVLAEELNGLGRRYLPIEVDLADPEAPAAIFERVLAELAAPQALVIAHTESVTSGLLETTVEALDRHYAVNVRAHAASATPLERQGTPDDAANLVRFLCSAQGGWINGQLLHSNGGFSSNIE